MGCPRPAGFATDHPGEGPCRRHGGGVPKAPKRPPGRKRAEQAIPSAAGRAVRGRRPGPKTPPEWKRAGEADPYAMILRRLAAAKRSRWPFPLAWADALYDALDGLPAGEFREWAGVMLETSCGWRDAYEGRASKVAELRR